MGRSRSWGGSSAAVPQTPPLPAQAEKEATEAPVSASRRFAGAGQAKLRVGYPAQDPTCRSGTAGLGEGSSGEAAGGLSSHRA